MPNSTPAAAKAAFAALVRQHVNLVFATAMRQVGDAGAAEEITQDVFVTLAQAAGKLGSHPTIAGWLHQTALNKSREWLRAELRRRKREQVSFNLRRPKAKAIRCGRRWCRCWMRRCWNCANRTGRRSSCASWKTGIFRKSVRSLASAKTRRASASTVVWNNSLIFSAAKVSRSRRLGQGAPLFALSAHAATARLAASATTAGLAAAHSAASTSTLTLIKGALKIMALTKAKTAIVAGAAILLAGGTTFVAVKEVRHSSDPAYDGNSLSGKLLSYQRSRDPAAEAAARKAMAKMGNNAIPALLNLLRSDSADKYLAARSGFSLLGSNASTAVPDLIRIYEERSCNVLNPKLPDHLAGSDQNRNQRCSLLLKSATNGNSEQAFAAVMALGQIHADSETVVPALIRLVHSTNKGVAIVTVEALGKFGPSAIDAIPVLLQVVTNNPYNGQGWRPAYTASDAIRDIQGHYP